MSKKTLSLNKNLVVHKPPAKNTFYEKYYLQNVKKLQELHDKLCRTPTIADIRSLINCETEQAEKLYNLYISDDKRNKDCQASLPNFLLKALNGSAIFGKGCRKKCGYSQRKYRNRKTK